MIAHSTEIASVGQPFSETLQCKNQTEAETNLGTSSDNPSYIDHECQATFRALAGEIDHMLDGNSATRGKDIAE